MNETEKWREKQKDRQKDEQMSPENQGVNKPKLHSVMTYGPCDNVTNGLETYKDQKSNH